ncbi:MAG: hypothetical protein JWL76_29 [Thermoleophilia bacterium]|nr:hypothetical protein [Thermoleophilia bacterium]
MPHTHVTARARAHRPRPGRTTAWLLAIAVLFVATLGSPAAASAATVSGNVLRDEATTLAWAGCDGVTQNVALRYNITTTRTTCDPVTGFFTMAPAFTATSRTVTIWLDGVAGSRGAIYTRNNGVNNITGLTLTQNRVRVRSETATVLTGTHIDGYDKTTSTDSDIPIDVTGGNTLDLDAGVELHVDAGESFDVNPMLYVNTTNLHLGAASTYTPGYWELILTGSGESTDCTKGPGLSMSLCLDAGATIPPGVLRAVFNPQDGDVVAPTNVQYLDFVATGGNAWTVHVGTATGQSLVVDSALRLGTWWAGNGRIDLSRFAPSVDAGFVELSDDSLLRSDQPGTMLVHGDLNGDGDVDLPKYDVTMNSDWPRTWLGPSLTGSEWRLGSLALRNSYVRGSFGATGIGPAYDSLAGQDTPTDVHYWGSNDYATHVGRSAAGAGSWMVRTLDSSATDYWTPGVTTWNPTAGDDYAATAVADIDSNWTTDLVVGGRINQNGGDWAIRRVDAVTGKFWGVTGGIASAFGNTDLDANGTNDTYVFGHATGNDQVTAMLGVPGDQVVVAGTTWNGTSQQVRVVRLSSTGTVVGSPLVYDTAGVDTGPQSLCSDQNEQEVYVVGGDPTNGGDVFVRSIEVGAGAFEWRGIGANTWGFGTVDLDASGQPDTARVGGANLEVGGGCQVNGEHFFLYGNRTTAGNTDGLAARMWDDGTLDSTWGTAGVATYDSGTNGDSFNGMIIDPIYYANGGLLAIGRFGTNGGDGGMVKFDGDGDIDRTWGTDGVLTVNTGGANVDSFAAMDMADGYSGTIEVAMLDGSVGGGDIRVRRYDVNGQLLNGAAGTHRIVAMSGSFEDDEARLTVTGNLTVGNAADASDTVLDLDTIDPELDVHGDTTIANRGWLRLSSAATTTLRGDLDNSAGGRIYAGSGRVRIRPAGTASTIRVGAAGGAPAFINSFAKLDLDLPTTGAPTPREVRLQAVTPTVVRSEIRASGTSCTSPLRILGAGGTAALTTTGATRTGNYTSVTNTTVSPATWTFANGNLSGTTTGFAVTTPCAAGAPLPPDDLFVSDTNAQVGTAHNLTIASATPHFSIVNRTATTVDQRRVKVLSDPVDAGVRHLLHLDGVGTDVGAAGGAVTLSGGINQPTYTGATGGAFANALSFDGNDRAATTTGGLDTNDEITIDTWVHGTNPATGGWPVIAYVTDGTRDRYFLQAGDDGSMSAGYVWGTGASDYNSVGGPTTIWDGAWHHVAMVVQRGGSGTTLRLVFDGEVVDTETFGQAPQAGIGAQLYLGNYSTIQAASSLRGDLDETRVSTRALSVDELRGYYRTGRPHGDVLWDSGAVAACTACPLANNARTTDLVYAGPGGLRLDGARYWVTTQLRTDATGAPATTWSSWSDPDWFEASATESLTVTTPTTVDIGSTAPGSDVSGSTSIDVTTTGGHGYTVYARGESDTWTMTSGIANIPPWTGGPTPTTWPTGGPGAGYFGVTLLAATGGKDTAKWGIGTTHSAYTDLKYIGVKKTSDRPLHTRTTYSTGTDVVTVGWRVNPPATLRPGTYRGTVTLVAVANP